jgi:hydroxyacylglutathione hydrolase
MSATPLVIPVLDQGLGNTAYLVDLGDRRGLAVDASRDLRALRAAAQRHGLTVAYAADTHLHADFLSGARQLARDGATVLASAAGRRQFPHTGLRDGDDVDLGGLRLTALGTPGHTDEHLAYLLRVGDRPLGVFTGGSLLVGAAARTDLMGPDRTEELARRQYRSLASLLTLPDEVAVWPTHGAGSFCSAPPGADRTSTIGREKATNPLLLVRGEDAFVAALSDSLGSYPPYFRWLAEQNRRGPAVLDRLPALEPVGPAAAWSMVADGAWLVDVRPVREFAAAHVAGSLSIHLRDVFATWLGWVAPPDRRLLVLRGTDQDPEEIGWQAAKVGYDNLVGEVAGGIEACIAAGLPIATTPVLAANGPGGPARRVLDVRQASEYASGHQQGAVHIELGDLPTRMADVPQEPLAVACAHGERAMTAASLLERAGRRDVAVVVSAAVGGPDEDAATHPSASAQGG